MLLTGHNGAGKSSVFRCLAGLWKIPEGQIQKPGSAKGNNSLAGTVFYLPQKPYNGKALCHSCSCALVLLCSELEAQQPIVEHF
jgi:ABC-type Mn2+/Zn2+ transport system ATPase subunit